MTTHVEREILERRARSLARQAAPPVPGGTIGLVTFSLSGERYAIESRYVINVFRLRALSRLPQAEPPVFGITTHRGALLTILDLRPVLGVSSTALNDMAYVLVVGTAQPAFGVLADDVHGLFDVAVGDVREPPPGVASRSEYVRGITREAVVVLAHTKLLAFDT